MPARAKVLRDGTIGREETLRLARGFEPLPPLLPLTGRLMRIFRSVVEIPVLAMFHSRQNLSLSGSVALEFVSHDHTRYISQSLEELAKELLRSLLVPSSLHEDIQHVPRLIYCSPQIVM